MPRSAQEHSSSPSRPQSNLTLGQAVTAYLSALSAEERVATAQELNSFTRWFGAQRSMSAISPPDLERYQVQLAAESRGDTTARLEALRAFLVEARRQGWIEGNLAVEVKLKRKKKSSPQGKAGAAGDAEDNGGIRFTRAGYDKLAKELKHLETEVRKQVANDLKLAAADKDFKENSPYDAAKQYQGHVEARIRELKNTLETGQIINVERSSSIDVGSKVTLRDLSEDEEIVYTLVGPGEIDPKQGKISIQSPVGRALTGKTVGDEVEVDVPNGKFRLRVEQIQNKQ